MSGLSDGKPLSQFDVTLFLLLAHQRCGNAARQCEDALLDRAPGSHPFCGPRRGRKSPMSLTSAIMNTTLKK
jgi:hypothetical protein